MGPLFYRRRIRYKTRQTKCARKANNSSMNTPPTQIRKLSVIFGELICFLSMPSTLPTHPCSEHRVRTVDSNR